MYFVAPKTHAGGGCLGVVAYNASAGTVPPRSHFPPLLSGVVFLGQPHFAAGGGASLGSIAEPSAHCAFPRARGSNLWRFRNSTARSRIAAQLRETPEKSNRQVAEGLGVDDKTVGAVRRGLESIAEIPQCDRETKDGRTYPAARKPIRTSFVDTLEARVAAKG